MNMPSATGRADLGRSSHGVSIQSDDDRLIGILQADGRELQVTRFIHVHLSLIKNRDAQATTLVRESFSYLQSTATSLSIFSLANGDLVVLYRGIKFAQITEICQKLETSLTRRGQFHGPNPYGEDSVFTILELQLQRTEALRVLEGLRTPDLARSVEAPQMQTKPPITLDGIVKVQQALERSDLTTLLTTQPVIDSEIEGGNPEVYHELYVAVRQIEEKYAPAYDITGNRWLFQYLTSQLDIMVVRSLGANPEEQFRRRTAINVNMPTVLSSAFVRFDQKLTSTMRGNVVLEIQISDVMGNEPMYREVLEFARSRNYKICIDGLTPFFVLNMNVAALDADFAKIIWSDAYGASIAPAAASVLERRVRDSRSTRYILARCGTAAALAFARSVGVKLLQGRIVDRIRAKGGRLKAAMEKAATDIAILGDAG